MIVATHYDEWQDKAKVYVVHNKATLGVIRFVFVVKKEEYLREFFGGI